MIIFFSVLWEDTLRDNLLNYAGTPKGVLLLQQTGALNECVTYLFSRYVRKLQVRLFLSWYAIFNLVRLDY